MESTVSREEGLRLLKAGAVEEAIDAVEPTDEEVAEASQEPEPAEAGEVEAAEELAEPGGEDGSLESILAEMTRKGQQE